MAFYKLDEIMGRVASEGGSAEMRIVREETFGACVNIGEITTAAAGDTDLLAELVMVVNEQHRFATLARFGGTHHAGSTGTNDDHIKRSAQRLTSSRRKQPSK